MIEKWCKDRGRPVVAVLGGLVIEKWWRNGTVQTQHTKENMVQCSMVRLEVTVHIAKLTHNINKLRQLVEQQDWEHYGVVAEY